MDLKEVRRRVKEIRSLAEEDAEQASSLEHKLYVDLLTSVANTDTVFSEIAKEAVKVAKLDFYRW